MEDDTPIETLISQVSFQLKWTLVISLYCLCSKIDMIHWSMDTIFSIPNISNGEPFGKRIIRLNNQPVESRDICASFYIYNHWNTFNNFHTSIAYTNYAITFREIKSKHTLPVLYGPTLGPGCLTVAVNSLPIIDLFLKVSPIRQQCYINICDD